MTDAQAALAQVREALAAGPTPGPWVTMPANAGVHCVARINAWEAVPPSDCELSHDSIDASFIAACSPANIAAILAHVDAQAAEVERLTAALRAQPGPVSLDDVEWAGKVHLAEAIRERDELRRQLAEAQQDARRYRYLRDQCSREVDDYGTVGIMFRCDFERYRWPDAAIDAAMGGGDAG